MSSTFYTSDLHLGHPHVAGLRGFSTVDEHDAAIDTVMHQRLRADSTLYVLGDVALGRYQRALGLVAQWPGTKHLVVGNHDKAHPARRGHAGAMRAAMDVFATVTVADQRRAEGHRLLLSHFPYDGEGERDGEDRFTQWRLRDEGGPLLHGHVHSSDRVTFSQAGTPQLHVGLDAWGLAPVDEPSVLALLSSSAVRGRG